MKRLSASILIMLQHGIIKVLYFAASKKMKRLSKLMKKLSTSTLAMLLCGKIKAIPLKLSEEMKKLKSAMKKLASLVIRTRTKQSQKPKSSRQRLTCPSTKVLLPHKPAQNPR